MKQISAFSIIISFIVLALIGACLIPELSVRLLPSYAMPSATISFSMANQSSRAVEIEVTSKLEGLLNRIKGIKHISSYSFNGGGQINIEVDKGSDMEMMRFEISSLIRQVWPQLPQGTSYPAVSIGSVSHESQGPFASFFVNGKASAQEITDFIKTSIEPKIAMIPGVYQISVSGAMPMQWVLTYDDDKLRSLNITPQQIQQAVSEHFNNQSLGVCKIEDGENINIVLQQSKTDELNLSQIFITRQNGRNYYLNQLATIRYEQEKFTSTKRINGQNTVSFSITSSDDANQLKIIRSVEEILRKTELPAHYEIHKGADSTIYLSKELDKIYFRTILTLLILLTFVFIVSRNFRYLLLIICCLAISLFISVVFYYLFGLEIELYSLAGITISLNLIIDNFIVMSSHILYKRNLKAFMAILAATLTSVAALGIIFLLDESQKANLQNFAFVTIINLLISLPVSLFLLPALIKKLDLKKRELHLSPRLKKKWNAVFFSKRWIIYFNRGYRYFIRIEWKRRAFVYVLLVLVFGLPLFLIPDKINESQSWHKYYNNIFSSNTYLKNIKPHINKYLGGTLRLFTESFSSSNNTERGETIVRIGLEMEHGATIDQTDRLIKKMEAFLSSFPEIKQFETEIQSSQKAAINIYFFDKDQRSAIPVRIKEMATEKAIHTGGGSWSVSGAGDGFNNNISQKTATQHILLYGYNYDDLWNWAEKIKESLLEHTRIKEVFISETKRHFIDNYKEYIFSTDFSKMIRNDINGYDLYGHLKRIYRKGDNIGFVLNQNKKEPVILHSRQSDESNIWEMKNLMQNINKNQIRFSDIAYIIKEQTPPSVIKENQQYKLSIDYNYLGEESTAFNLKKELLDNLKNELPLGYFAVNGDSMYWDIGKKNQYGLLFIIIVIIFFICSILFNSLSKPLIIIAIIPVSFIGLFLSCYWFNIPVSEGTYAALVLLCGITVNSSIYIVNDYVLNIKKGTYDKLTCYIRAFNAKITPICLTILSTILGFIPFIIGNYRDPFWEALTTGTIGGLITSLIGIFFFLPMFLGVGKIKPKNNRITP